MTAAAGPSPTVPVEASCRCYAGRRRPAIRITVAVAAEVRRAVEAAGIPLQAVLADWRCPTCKQVVDLTLGQLLAVGTS